MQRRLVGQLCTIHECAGISDLNDDPFGTYERPISDPNHECRACAWQRANLVALREYVIR